MRKTPCLFVGEVDAEGRNTGRATPEIAAQCAWVAEGVGVATRKWDGTACAVIGGKLYARLDAKRGSPLPEGAVKCAPETPDDQHGGKVYWIPVVSQPQFKWHLEAWSALAKPLTDGTYELIGPRINGNPDRAEAHEFKRHGDTIYLDAPRDFEGLRAYLARLDAEGIVFHHPDGVRMAKVRKRDFGIKRGAA